MLSLRPCCCVHCRLYEAFQRPGRCKQVSTACRCCRCWNAALCPMACCCCRCRSAVTAATVMCFRQLAAISRVPLCAACVHLCHCRYAGINHFLKFNQPPVRPCVPICSVWSRRAAAACPSLLVNLRCRRLYTCVCCTDPLQTNDTFNRAAAYPNFELHTGSEWQALEPTGDGKQVCCGLWCLWSAAL